MRSIKISFFPEVIRGIAQIAADHQYSIQLCTGQDNHQRLAILKDTILGRRVDGLIFLYGGIGRPSCELCDWTRFPAVIIGKTFPLLFHLSIITMKKRDLTLLNTSLIKAPNRLLLSVVVTNFSYLENVSRDISKLSKNTNLMLTKNSLLK